jgi:hypothetical protein
MTSALSSWHVRLLAVLGTVGCVGGLLAMPALLHRSKSSRPVTSVHLEETRFRSLKAQREAILARINRKEALIQDLIVGRKTLLEVAGPFYVLHREVEDRFPRIPRDFSNLPEPERACRIIIDRVWNILGNEPERARVIIARLEEELDSHLQAGTLRLSLPSMRKEAVR